MPSGFTEDYFLRRNTDVGDSHRCMWTVSVATGTTPIPRRTYGSAPPSTIGFMNVDPGSKYRALTPAAEHKTPPRANREVMNMVVSVVLVLGYLEDVSRSRGRKARR